MEAVHYEYAPALGGCRVKLTQSGRGVNVEVSVTRPREEGESHEDAARAAVDLASMAYRMAQQQLELPSMPVSIVDGGRS